jgi:hypothetical protein
LAKLKNKVVFFLLLFGLLSMISVFAACDSTTELDDGVSTIPHDLGVGFDNCLACHTGALQSSELEKLPALHNEYPVELCSSPACHPQNGVMPLPEWEPPVITTHDIEGAYDSDNCMICHDAYKRYEPPVNVSHAVHTNEICFICHETPEE